LSHFFPIFFQLIRRLHMLIHSIIHGLFAAFAKCHVTFFLVLLCFFDKCSCIHTALHCGVVWLQLFTQFQ
jgi:hypothetical protein